MVGGDMNKVTKMQKKEMNSKYTCLQIIEDLLDFEDNDDKKEALRMLKKELMRIYGNN